MSTEQNAGLILVRKNSRSAENMRVDVDTIAALIVERYPATSVSEARSIILDIASYLGYSQRSDVVESESIASNVQSLRFAEILDADGRKIHVGCVMAFGEDWVEVSYPAQALLESPIHLRFLPSTEVHTVDLRWRHDDRAGFAYPDGTPPDAPHLIEPEAVDPSSVAEKVRE